MDEILSILSVFCVTDLQSDRVVFVFHSMLNFFLSDLMDAELVVPLGEKCGIYAVLKSCNMFSFTCLSFKVIYPKTDVLQHWFWSLKRHRGYLMLLPKLVPMQRMCWWL